MKGIGDWLACHNAADLLTLVPNRPVGRGRRCRLLAAEVLRRLTDLELAPVLRGILENGYVRDHVRGTARLWRRTAPREPVRALRRAADALDADGKGECPLRAFLDRLGEPYRRGWAGVGVPHMVTHDTTGWVTHGDAILSACANPVQLARTVRLAEWLAHVTPGDTAAIVLYRRALAALVRDVFLPPIHLAGARPWHRKFDPAWRTDTAIALARQMDRTREFSAMPILADALQDAGCDHEPALALCRAKTDYGSPVPHCRGSWVLEAVLEGARDV